MIRDSEIPLLPLATPSVVSLFYSNRYAVLDAVNQPLNVQPWLLPGPLCVAVPMPPSLDIITTISHYPHCLAKLILKHNQALNLSAN
jgi:hypothetical protein